MAEDDSPGSRSAVSAASPRRQRLLIAVSMESVPLVDKLTVFLKLFDSGDHLTIKLARSWVM